MSGKRCVFIAGETGYIGSRLIPRLLERGHEVHALARANSEKKLPPGCLPGPGDALEWSTYADKIARADTFVQLVGVAHSSPAKAAEFRTVDLVSGLGAVQAAKDLLAIPFSQLRPSN
jgi:nucleoside-diphosphate-sugar epimerase